MPTIGNQDLFTLLLCSVRYAMGRQSYIVGEICNLVEHYASALTEDQLELIKNDVSREIKNYEDRGEILGAMIDHKQWKSLVTFLESF